MTTTPVQFYVLDSAFTRRNQPAPPFYRNIGGIGQLSSRGLSYFQTPYQFHDPRLASARSVNWAPVTQSALLIDHDIYPDFINAITAASSAVNGALFGLIDLLAFSYNAGVSAALLESEIAGSAALSPYYQASSLSVGSGTNSGLIYNDNGTTALVVCPTRVSFIFNIPSGGATLSFAVTAWVDNAAFLSYYPNSSIVAIIPPTNYSDLLSLSVQTTSGKLATLAAGAAFVRPLVNAALLAREVSGYTSYTAKLVDGNATLNIPFGVLYVGQIPTFAAMRAAIRQAVESSGIGTPALWKLRIPELYVASRLYLIPIWDQRITTGSGTLYSGISSSATQLAKVTLILAPSSAGALVNTHNEFLTAAYNLLPIVVVPNSISQPIDTLESLFPTYQSYAPTDPNFLYMDPAAQSFAGMLNSALPVAAGVTTDPSYAVVIDGPLTFVSFTQQLTEFAIITKDFYAAQLGVSV